MAFIGSVRGGLAYVNILANMFVSSILGSATAQVAIMAQIMVPEMEKQGYDKTFAAGLTAYGGMLGHHPALGDVRRLFGAGAGLGLGHAHRRHPARRAAHRPVLHLHRHHGG